MTATRAPSRADHDIVEQLAQQVAARALALLEEKFPGTASAEPKTLPRFIPLAPACEILGISRLTHWRLEKAGKLPPRSVSPFSGRTGYFDHEIEAILADFRLVSDPGVAAEQRRRTERGRKAFAARQAASAAASNPAT